MEAYARFSPGEEKWTRKTIAQHISIGENGPVLIGTAQQVADGIEIWVRDADVDGFKFCKFGYWIHLFVANATDILLGVCFVPAVIQRYY